jgi:phosphopantothenoylcysteine decarboxylase/phosphopantothenate--cysteine ligase
MVSAGPTYEAIDPVRFIGNYSSGKMGFAIAEEFAQNGANVILISGPSNIEVQNPNIQRINVKSADEMFLECNKAFTKSDIAIMAAAIADYKPAKVFDKKIKKTQEEFSEIKLVKTKDVLKSLGESKRENQTLIGFALETDNEIDNAIKKLNSKNLDFIVLNSLQDKGAGFGHDTNKVKIIDKKKEIFSFNLMSKSELAKKIVGFIENYLK